MTQETPESKNLSTTDEQKAKVREIVMKHILDVWKDLSPSVQVEFLNTVLKNDPRK